jgi:hypothetical protein
MAKAQVRRIVEAQPDEEAEMNHHETIALAEMHRSALLSDASGIRRARRSRTNRRGSLRTLFTQARHS